MDFTIDIDEKGGAGALLEVPATSVRHVDLRRHRLVDVRRGLGLQPPEFDLLLAELGIVPEKGMITLKVLGRLEYELGRRARVRAGMR